MSSENLPGSLVFGRNHALKELHDSIRANEQIFPGRMGLLMTKGQANELGIYSVEEPGGIVMISWEEVAR